MNKLQIIFILIFYTQFLFAQNSGTPIKLNETLTRTIQSEERQDFQIELKKGEFALFRLQQKGIDLKIVTFTIDGIKLDEFDAPNGSSGEELVFLDATHDGSYLISVFPLGQNKKNKQGSYDLTFFAKNTSAEKHLNEILELLDKRNFLTGFAVGLTDDESTFCNHGFGFSNFENKKKYTTETVQCIASISKTLIAVSLMMLVEQGKFDLDTKINDLLPFKVVNPHFPNVPITIEHLATHTATIKDEPHLSQGYILEEFGFEKKYDYQKSMCKELKKMNKNKAVPLPDFLRNVLSKSGSRYRKKNFFKRPPGKEWYYSNIGSALAAYIVEVVSSQPFHEFTRKNIFEPLDLKSAVWSITKPENLEIARSYDYLKNPLPYYHTTTYPDGGLFINSSDLTKYLTELMRGFNGKGILLNSDSYQKIMAVRHVTETGDFKGKKQGLFWEFGRKDDRIGKSGGDTGITTMMFFYPKDNVGITVICNTLPLDSGEALAEFRAVWAALVRYGKLWKSSEE